MNDPKRILVALALVIVIALPGFAQTIFPTQPDWTSTDTPVSTGGAVVDLNLDGWVDLVVANGNDMAIEPVTVYYNQGDGSFPSVPDWSSSDTAYNGHLDVADVNGDGWPDVAVAVLGSGDSVDNMVKLYLNNAGTLSATPDWQSNEVGNAFACAFGDVNNDGRPDLALATGWAYSPQNHYNNYVYVNQDGLLPSTATWVSDDNDHLQGVLWIDADGDGWLDLVGVASLSQTSIYSNLGGSLETTASWHTTDAASQDAIMAACGDLNGDGAGDLLITDNTQIGGSGLLRQYSGIPGGGIASTYDWSTFVGYGSAVAIGDVNDDGFLDAVSGGWWESLEIFFNTGSGLSTVASWTSEQSTVVEKILLVDVDNDGVQNRTYTAAVDGGRLFDLGHQPIIEIDEVILDGIALTPEHFMFSRDSGWLTVRTTPLDTLVVSYRISKDLDIVVTNWDNDVGNQMYLNRSNSVIFSDGFESGDISRW
ncbi:MAG: VCBS repeat-containing protein [bacterium]|nr:VCBS repeat-containing protein [bacterium]